MVVHGDDDCPYCGARHMSPFKSSDLTAVVEASDDAFVVLRSSQAAEHQPDYRELGCFPTREQADKFMAGYTPKEIVS